MDAIRLLAATAFLILATVSCRPAIAGEGADYRVASLGNAERNGSLSVNVAPVAAGRMRAAPTVRLGGSAGWSMPTRADASVRQVAAAVESAALPEQGATRTAPAVSLDRRVPAAQVTDREGLSLIGVLGAVSEIGHAFSRKDGEQPAGQGAARVVRTLRDSVFGKRISILSESGRIAENDPFLVGLSFTH